MYKIRAKHKNAVVREIMVPRVRNFEIVIAKEDLNEFQDFALQDFTRTSCERVGTLYLPILS